MKKTGLFHDCKKVAEPADVNAAAPEADSTEQSPDIVVTGTRRAARLQDVPVSVVAIGKDAILASGYI